MFRNKYTDRIDWDLVGIMFVAFMVVGAVIFMIVYFAMHEHERSKLPEILHYKTQLGESVNVEIWRKDRQYLNDTIILVDDSTLQVQSIGDYLEIPIEGAKIVSYEINPIYRIHNDFFSSTLTNKVQRYIVSMQVEWQ